MVSLVKNSVAFGLQVVKQAAAPVISSVMGAVLSLGFQNHSVGKIVGGTSMVLGGGYLFVKSGVIKCTSWSWLRSIQQEPKNKAPSTAVRTACAATGVLMMAAGATSIAVGIKELFEHSTQDVYQQSFDSASSYDAASRLYLPTRPGD